MSLKYIITTANGYTEALDALLASMYTENIPEEDIVISCQNFYNKIDYYKQYIQVNINQQIYEYSFFITVMKLLDANLAKSTDSFFLIHDTCLLSYGHTNRIQKILNDRNHYDIIFANGIGRHNIGIYNYKSISLGFDIWKNIEFINKHLAIAIEHNTYGKELCIKNYNLKIYYPNISWKDEFVENIYSNHTKRLCSNLPYFKIRKFFIWIDHNDKHPNIP